MGCRARPDIKHAGAAKPSPAIFALAAAQLGIPLGNCVMIGDDPNFDIRASLHTGVAAALLIDPRSDRPCSWSAPGLSRPRPRCRRRARGRESQ
ncbi:HAD hydrolase-like protein [Actinoplanes sp. NPDC026619]|uniref:HAD family hydrolase n=1 Tax=Actinoplanes sp. NPDC026619 TaxID=3155798 RepID=UPI0033DD7DA7